MKRKPVKENNNILPVSADVMRGSAIEDTAANNQGGFLTVIKPIIFAILLFFAMTAQTGRMSMILCVLALLSLLGKKPIARFRSRLCVPVLGLLAFAVMQGAAAIYSPFGADAVSEYYKFLAALSLAVILLARFDRGDVRGLLWGTVSVSGAVSLISVDMNCAQAIYSPFNALMNVLGADFTNALESTVNNARVNGLYNDANVTAAIFAMTSIVALYLFRSEEKLYKRFAAALLAGVNMMGLMVTGSRGALLCFAVACLVWLVAERRNRLGLFLVLVEAAVSLGVSAIPCSILLERHSEAALGLFFVCGVLIFGLEWLLGRWLERVLSAHRKTAVLTVCGVCAALLAVCVAVFTHTGTYTFAADGGDYYHLLPSGAGDYTLSGDWDGDLTAIVYSQTQLERYRSGGTRLYEGPLSDCSYTVSDDAAEVHVRILGQGGETIRSLAVSDGTDLKLSYPWLPDAISSRLLDDRLLGGNSMFMRLQYVKDTWTLFLQSPILGYGLSSTENLTRSVQSFQYESKYAHNHLLQTMSDTGLLGMVFAVAFVLGCGWLCLTAVRKEKDSLAAALLAVWGMMNLHSLMEINFSVRGFRCIAYVLLLLSVLLYARPLIKEEAGKKQMLRKLSGVVLAAVFGLYLAVFAGLLESHRIVERQEYYTSSIYEYLDTLKKCISRDVFDTDSYQLDYVANAAHLRDPKYNGSMFRYATALRKSGTFENCSALARYYYLPRGEWEDIFAVSREGIVQVRSSPDGWNLQMDFYRQEVLPAMGPENMDVFLAGVIALGDALDDMNAEGRMETVELSEENQTFLALCRFLKEQGLAGEDAYTLLSITAGSAQPQE